MSQSPDSKYTLKRADGQIVTLPDWLPGKGSEDSEEEEYQRSPSDRIPFGSLICECLNLIWGDPLKNG